VADLLYLFEDCVLDTGTRELRRGDAAVAIEPKAFDLLAYLIENRQRVVSKDDLIAAVWDGRIVSDTALFTRINAARTAIGDSGEAQRLIKTLPRKGVRFVGSVCEEQASSRLATPPAAGAEKPVPTLALPDGPSIAVLPFDNVSGNKDQDYFCDGITDDIITELSRFSELFVIARNSSFQYKGRAIDVRQVGRELGVRYILQGSIRREGGRVRISAQLADAVIGTHRWAERYDRQIEDVFAVQDEMARTIAAILAAHVNKAEIERTLQKPPAAWQAYDYYLRAVDAYVTFWPSYTETDLREVRRLLEQSLAIDPKYARAWARLGATHLTAWINHYDRDHLNPAALDRAHELARKAVQLDPSLPEAQAILAQVLSRRGEHDAAIAAFERAMALNPNFMDWRFAEVLVQAGEPERAIATIERHMRLDPFYAPLAPGWLGLAHYMLKQYTLALAPARECAAQLPNLRLGHHGLAAAYAQLGKFDEARAEAAEMLRIDPKYTISRAARMLPFKRPEDAEHYFDGLRKAGLPER
jgi:adenylate cyclase